VERLNAGVVGLNALAVRAMAGDVIRRQARLRLNERVFFGQQGIPLGVEIGVPHGCLGLAPTV